MFKNNTRQNERDAPNEISNHFCNRLYDELHVESYQEDPLMIENDCVLLISAISVIEACVGNGAGRHRNIL